MFYGDCSACASACAAAECACAFDSQGLYRSEGGEGALRQGLDLVVVERQQREILQVLEGVGANAMDLIGVQQPGEEGKRTEEGDVKRGGEDGGKQLVRVSLWIHSLCIPSRKLCTGTKFISRARLLH